eukprot:GFUD01077700.1.p1 GENE.GFUD01077700.1~~GFUD01077700.1.p1  ORF type:complete len:507 (-),score=80.92 GFUD01077700.1:74-1507(-)
MGVVVGDRSEGDKMNAILISKQKDEHKHSGTNVEQFLQSTGELITKHVEKIRKLIPLPSIQSYNDLKKVLKNPRRIRNKPVHVLFILLSMLACIAMFSAQLWDASNDCNEDKTCPGFNDHEDTFARRWVYGMINEISTRKVIILVSTPITFLLSTILLLLMRDWDGDEGLWMLLSGLLSLGLGLFFLIFSLYTVQCIILMGPNLSNFSFILKLVSLVPSPLLAAICMALAYSYMIQMVEEDEDDRKSNTGNLSVPSILIITPPGSLMPMLSLSSVSPVSGKLSLNQSSAYSHLTVIVFLFLSMATMTSSNLVMMSTLQEHWNITHGQGWHQDCRGNRITIITIATPISRPDNCYYDIQLSYEVQNDFTFFSISQLLLTESILVLCIFITMAGKRTPKKILFYPGLFLFLAAIATITAFFSGIVQYDLKTNRVPFLILNSANTLTALILGCICVIAGAPVFLSCIGFFFSQPNQRGSE